MFYLTLAGLFTQVSLAQNFSFDKERISSHAIYLRSMDVQTADLNKDGYVDIVLAVEWAPNAILWGNKDGRFYDQHSMKLSTNNFDSEDIAIADFNNDGWLDLVFAAEDDMNHEFYLNQGNGRFEEVKNKFPQFISNAVQAYDFNGDGAIDLIFGNQGQSRLFINDGKGNFTEETESRLPQDENTTTQDIALVDVNHDGNIDIIMGNENGNQLWINRGKGFFTNETAGRFPSSPDMETRKVIIIDVNQDGHPDVFLCNVAYDDTKKKQDKLYLNDGKGNFADVTETHLPAQDLSTLDALPLDVNHDGHPDLILAHGGKVKPSVFINDGSGKFMLDESVLSGISFLGNYIAILAQDFNQDGKPDIYLGGFMSADMILIQNN